MFVKVSIMAGCSNEEKEEDGNNNNGERVESSFSKNGLLILKTMTDDRAHRVVSEGSAITMPKRLLEKYPVSGFFYKSFFFT